jgi:hypothetical protein
MTNTSHILAGSVVLDLNSKKYFSKSLQNVFLIGTFSIFFGFKLQLNMKLFPNTKMVDLKQLMTYGVSLIAGLIASITLA